LPISKVPNQRLPFPLHLKNDFNDFLYIKFQSEIDFNDFWHLKYQSKI
jgi:hypothetical protein